MFAFSFLCHVILFLVVVKLNLLALQAPVEPPAYYVDLVTPPVASPQAGVPAPPAPSAAQTATPPAEEAAPVLPVKPPAPKMTPKSAKTAPTAKGKGKPAAAESSQEFNERLAKLARESEAKSYNQSLAKIAKDAKSGGRKMGIPGGKGTQAGSDYSSWIQSRLQDAFRTTIASDTSAPSVRVRLTIGPDGRIKRYRVEQSTRDRVFEDAVERAVHLAEKSFKPPPGGSDFEQGFVFRPQGVGIK